VASASAALTASTQSTPATTPALVPHAQWWPQVVQQVVHLLIVGESQEGKSTTARALLHARARSEDARA
jgi:NaMN:DMB phosphoribosyltransferase